MPGGVHIPETGPLVFDLHHESVPPSADHDPNDASAGSELQGVVRQVPYRLTDQAAVEVGGAGSVGRHAKVDAHGVRPGP